MHQAVRGGILKHLAIALFLVLTCRGAFAATLEGRVVGVADGDTVTVLDADRRQHKIRLGGIYGVIHAISCISGCTDCNEWISSKLAIISSLAMTNNPISHERNFTHPPHESPIYAFFPTRFYV